MKKGVPDKQTLSYNYHCDQNLSLLVSLVEKALKDVLVSLRNPLGHALKYHDLIFLYLSLVSSDRKLTSKAIIYPKERHVSGNFSALFG